MMPRYPLTDPAARSPKRAANQYRAAKARDRATMWLRALSDQHHARAAIARLNTPSEEL